MSRLPGRIVAWYRKHAAADLVLLAVLTFPAWRLALASGYLGGHDGLFHLLRLVELDGAVRSGIPYPRLAPDLALGYDYPVFNFYPPLAAYLSEIFSLAGLGYVDAAKPVLVLTIVGSAWAMLLFARSELRRSGAIVAALAYAYLPYLLIDLYVRAAYAEAVALPLLPLCLYACGKAARCPTAWHVTWAALAIGVLLIAHNITSLVFVPLLAIWTVVALIRSREDNGVASFARRAAGALASATLGLALAAFYWMPALFERDLVQSAKLVEGFFDYHSHLAPLGALIQGSLAYDFARDPAQAVPYQIGLAQLAIAVAGCLASAFGGRRLRTLGAFWGCILLVTLLLQTPHLSFAWEAIPFGAFVQFPWRLLAFAGLASAFLAGCLVSVLCSRVGWVLTSIPRIGTGATPPAALRLWLAWTTGIAITIVLVASAMAGLRISPLSWRNVDLRPGTLRQMEADQKLVALTPGEYLPRTVAQVPFDGPSAVDTAETAGDARLTVTESSAFRVAFDVVTANASTVLLDRFFFPGWQATSDGSPLPIEAAGDSGLLALRIPAGHHHILVSFGNTPLRSAAIAISLIAVLIVLSLAVLPALARRQLEPSKQFAGVGAHTGRVVPAWLRSACLRIDARTYLFLIPAAVVFVAAFLNRDTSGEGAVLNGGVTGFGANIRLAGVAVSGSSREAVLALTLYWQANAKLTDDYVVSLRLLDEDGRVVGKRDKRPLEGLRPTTQWLPHELVRDRQEIALNAGSPAGDYELAVGVMDKAAGQYLAPQGAVTSWKDGRDEGTGIALGKVHAPTRLLDGAFHPAITNIADFGGQIALDDFDVQRVDGDGNPLPRISSSYLTTVGQGERLRVSFHWHSERDVDADYAVFLHLLDAQQNMVAQGDQWMHAGFYPSVLWLPGETVTDQYTLEIPSGVPAGRYVMVVGRYRRSDLSRLRLSDGSDQLTLGAIKVTDNPPLHADRLASIQRVDAVLGNAQLLGFKTAGAQSPGLVELHPGGALQLNLYWQAIRPIGADYSVFIHVYDAQGKLRAQTDGPAVAGNYPTSLWQAGEVVADSHVLTIPPGLDPGRYRLVVGLYQLKTGMRLRQADGEDSVELGAMVVE